MISFTSYYLIGVIFFMSSKERYLNKIDDISGEDYKYLCEIQPLIWPIFSMLVAILWPYGLLEFFGERNENQK